MIAKNVRSDNQARLVDGAFFLVLLVLAYVLKRHYSQAGAQELEWILGPIAAVVGWAGGMSFDSEIGTGFIDRDSGIIIAPACAGVNFMIVAILSAGWGAIPRLATVRRKAIGLLPIVLTAYLLAVAVNSLRILLSIQLYGADIYTGWMTPGGVHRLAGIVLYLIALCCYCRAGRWFLITAGSQPKTIAEVNHTRRKNEKSKNAAGRHGHPGQHAGSGPERAVVCRPAAGATHSRVQKTLTAMRDFTWTPIIWYVVIVIGVPLANGAGKQFQGRFMAHLLAVVAGCMTVVLLFFLIRSVYRRKPHAFNNPDRGR